MPPPCNKCKRGIAQEADTWCLGCSSLEISQGLLRQTWKHAGLRAVAEEALLSSARLVRAFGNLDGSLGGPSAGSAARAPGLTTAAKSKPAVPPRSRSPRRDDRPPLVRSPGRASRGGSAAPPRPESESEDFDEDEEEEEEEDEPATEVKRERDGSRRPPEPEGPPPSKREATERSERSPEGRKEERKKRREGEKKSRGKRRRGGTRHQRRHKDQENPFRRSHRRLKADQLELASNLEEGLERRH